MLEQACNADLDRVSGNFVESIAIELGAGRSEANLVQSGMCNDPHVIRVGEVEKTYSTLVFEGRIVTEAFLEVGVPGAHITINTAARDKPLCEEMTYGNGSYRCKAIIESPASSTMSLTFKVSVQGQVIEQIVAVDSPSANGVQFVKQNFTAPVESFLHFTGRVTQNGAALADARIEISGPALILTRADAFGQYSVYVPVAEGMRDGAVFYRATAPDGKGYVEQQTTFEVGTSDITEIAFDLAVNPAADIPEEVPVASTKRTVTFRGRIANAVAPELSLAGIAVSIGAPDNFTPGTCNAVTNRDGDYSCTGTVERAEGFDVTVTATGFGTSARQTLQVSGNQVPSEGSSAVIEVADLSLSPTVLSISGVVGAPDEPAYADVTFTLVGVDGILTSKQLSTDFDGRYELSFIVPATADLTVLQLAYTVSTGMGELSEEVSLTALGANTLNVRTLDIEYVNRTIDFSGYVTNLYDETFKVPNVVIDISRVDTG